MPPTVASLVDHYLAGRPDAARFYAASPSALFTEAPVQAPWLAVDTARRESVVVTGQQPGLLTGPLYTVYKAITAIHAARTVTERTGAACTPLFWIGGDDHDFEEVRSAHILSRRHEVASLRYAPETDIARFPMFEVALEDSLHGLVDAAAAAATGSEFADEVTAFLHASLDDAASFSDWMGRIMARLFERTPLRFFSPDDPTARRAAALIFERELNDPLATTQLVNAAGEQLEALGYPPQLTKNPTECAFFLQVERRRAKVVFEDGRFSLPEERVSFTPDEMRGILAASPERFTANVALRCIVQQHLFPVAAYVAGPGEMAYWAQLKEVFKHHGLPMPIVYPRLRAVVTTPKLAKLLAKNGLSLDDMTRPEADLVEEALRNAAGASALAPHRQDMDAVRGAAERLARAAGPEGESFGKRVDAALARLEHALIHRDRARTEAIRAQVHRLCNSLAPERKPQERVLNVFSFLFAHGWDFVPRVMRALDVEDFTTQEISL